MTPAEAGAETRKARRVAGLPIESAARVSVFARTGPRVSL